MVVFLVAVVGFFAAGPTVSFADSADGQVLSFRVSPLDQGFLFGDDKDSDEQDVVMVQDSGDSSDVDSFAKLTERINGKNNQTITVTISADFTTDDISKLDVPEGATVTISSSGNHTITVGGSRFVNSMGEGSSLTLGSGLKILSSGHRVVHLENESTLTLNGVTINGEDKPSTEPVLASLAEYSIITIDKDTIIEHCKNASENDKGIIYVCNGSTCNVQGKIRECNAESASAPLCVEDATLSVMAGTIELNRGKNAGAIYCRKITRGSTLTLAYSQIKWNYSLENGGGIVAIGSSVLLNRGTIGQNECVQYGGGIAVFNGTILTFEDENIVSNKAADGGGIYIKDCSNVTLSSGTVESNEATGANGVGGGILIAAQEGSAASQAKLYDALITGNKSTNNIGGGIWVGATGSMNLNVSDGAAVYANEAAKAGDDVAAIYPASSGAGRSTMSQRMLGGGLAQSYTDGGVSLDANPENNGVGNNESRYRDNSSRAEFDASSWNGTSTITVHNEPSTEAIALQDQLKKLVIRDNKATDAGGGIAVKGHLEVGRSESKEVIAKKAWVVPSGTSALSSATVSLYIDGARDQIPRKVEQVVLDASNGWQYDFTDLPVKAKVSLEEDALSATGWVTYYEEQTEGQGQINSAESSLPGTLQSTYDKKTTVNVNNALAGTLRLEMSVSGDLSDPNKESTYQVSIVNPEGSLSGQSLSVQDDSSGSPYKGRNATHRSEAMDFTYSGSKSGTLAGGEGTITLKGGESVTIAGLPHGAHYAISQTSAADGYVVTPVRENGQTGSAAQEGTITGGHDAVLTYQNVKESAKGSLKIENTVTGTGADVNKQFHYEVRFYESDGTTELASSTSFPYTGPGSASGTIATGNQIALKSGESVTVGSIPEGTCWKVTQSPTDSEGYTVTASREALTGDDAQKGAIVADTTATLSYMNAKDALPSGSLVVSKVLEEGDANRAFEIVLTLGASDGSGPDSGSYAYTGSTTGNVSNGSTLRLKGGQQVVISGLPPATTYKVEEVNASDYTVTYDGQEGAIVQDATAVAKVTNKINETPEVGAGGGSERGSGSPPTPEPAADPGNNEQPEASPGAINEQKDTSTEQGATSGKSTSSSSSASPSTGDSAYLFVETIGGCALAIALLAATFIMRNWRKRIEHR